MANMKVVILAGGLGTRISEETMLRPKPMVEIGSKPILWHIMKSYSAYGFNDFIICCGYKGFLIKEYFANYFLHMSDVTIDLKNNAMQVHHQKAESWKVTLIDTGENSMTGGRLKRVQEHLKDEKSFFMTYGDGLSDIDLTKSLQFHEQHGKLATVTAVQPPGRYGVLNIEGSQVVSFLEKPTGKESMINGGFFVLSPKCLDLIEGDSTIWEKEPMEALSKQGQLMAFEHAGFWQSMDTLRDKNQLEEHWITGKAPWKNW
jgi:glucose-1-phosphate cytidylyltransferase